MSLSHYAFRLDPVTKKHIVKATLVDAETTRNTLRLDGPCIYCKQAQSFTVPAEQLIALGQGKPVQECFPDLPASQREFLLSGTCDACWDKLFPEVDDVRDG